MKQELENKLAEEFTPEHLSVRDDSALHARHKEAQEHGGGHYTIIMVTKAFEGIDKVSRHRAVYKILENMFTEKEIHALSMQLFTPAEWF